ncbi:MAG: TRAP transporter small permease [Thermodesulfobacteriota bacterium]
MQTQSHALRSLDKGLRYLDKIMFWAIFILAAIMFLMVFLQVIMRYSFITDPFSFSEELARYLMVWIVCIGSAGAYSQGMHIGVNLFTGLLPAAGQIWVARLVHMAVGGLMGVIIFEGGRLSYFLANQFSPAMEIKMTWPYLAVPVGAFLILIQAAALLIKGFAGAEKPLNPQENKGRCSP